MKSIKVNVNKTKLTELKNKLGLEVDDFYDKGNHYKVSNLFLGNDKFLVFYCKVK